MVRSRAFLDHLKIERQASAHTIRSYEHDLGLYCRYLREAQGRGPTRAAVDSGPAASLFGLADGQGFAASTVARRLASLRSFFRYLRRQGWSRRTRRRSS